MKIPDFATQKSSVSLTVSMMEFAITQRINVIAMEQHKTNGARKMLMNKIILLNKLSFHFARDSLRRGMTKTLSVAAFKTLMQFYKFLSNNFHFDVHLNTKSH